MHLSPPTYSEPSWDYESGLFTLSSLWVRRSKIKTSFAASWSLTNASDDHSEESTRDARHGGWQTCQVGPLLLPGVHSSAQPPSPHTSHILAFPWWATTYEFPQLLRAENKGPNGRSHQWVTDWSSCQLLYPNICGSQEVPRKSMSWPKKGASGMVT